MWFYNQKIKDLSELRANGLEMEGTVSSNFIHICVVTKLDFPKVEENNVRWFPELSNLTLDQRPTSIGRRVTPDLMEMSTNP